MQRPASPARSSRTTAPSAWRRSWPFSRPPRSCRGAASNDMPKIWIYRALNQGRLTTPSLELFTRARELGDVDAVALGPGAMQAAGALGRHGARRVLANEDVAFAEYLAEPATDCLAALVAQERPDLIMFGFSPD